MIQRLRISKDLRKEYKNDKEINDTLRRGNGGDGYVG
jgi:hypothetical protein